MFDGTLKNILNGKALPYQAARVNRKKPPKGRKKTNRKDKRA
jgi:hypothetical protein